MRVSGWTERVRTMGKKIDAAETAARISRAYGLPICELMDLFAEIPDADRPKDCGSCKWHEDFNGVCFNGDSERCAGYTDSDESCGEWEGKS